MTQQDMQDFEDFLAWKAMKAAQPAGPASTNNPPATPLGANPASMQRSGDDPTNFMPMSKPSDLPQTNQGVQRPTAVQMHYNFPPNPQCLYITPAQLNKIITQMKAQGVYPANAEIRRDAADDFLPDTMGDGTYYSLYWRDEQGVHADQLGYLYNEFQDHLVAAQRVNDPYPQMVRDTDNGTISFK